MQAGDDSRHGVDGSGRAAEAGRLTPVEAAKDQKAGVCGRKEGRKRGTMVTAGPFGERPGGEGGAFTEQ